MQCKLLTLRVTSPFQKNGSAVPLAIQRQIFSVVVPLVLLFLCAIFWVVWCVLRAKPLLHVRTTPHFLFAAHFVCANGLLPHTSLLSL